MVIRRMMKVLYSIFLCLLLIFPAFSKDKEDISIETVFPRPSELRGGASHWISTGVSLEERDNCKLYESNYSYYSKTREKILDIERNNQYVISARVYDCNNISYALEKYKELSNISKSSAKHKNQVASVPFGDIGIMVVLPFKDRKDKTIHQANYYITYVYRNFVVQVYSDDGFAQVDMAGFLEASLNKYLLDKGINYALNKINFKIEYNGQEFLDSLSFLGENVSSVIVKGHVFNADNQPVSNAKVTVLETNQVIKTDNQGKFYVKVSSGSKKVLSMNKVIFLGISEGESILQSRLYPVTILSKGKESNALLDLLITNNKISGYFIDPLKNQRFLLNGSINKDKFTFTVNCTSSNSSSKCLRTFTSSIVEPFKIQGKVKGTGAGSFTIDKAQLSINSQDMYLKDTNIDLNMAEIRNNELIYLNEPNIILSADKDSYYLDLDTHNYNKDDILYLKDGSLILPVIESSIKGRAKLVLYAKNFQDDKLYLENLYDLYDFSSISQPSLSIDISSLLRHANANGYLIGFHSTNKLDYIIFDKNKLGINLQYYRDKDSYIPKHILEASLITFDGKDIVSNKGILEKDGDLDIILSLKVALKGSKLEQLDIVAKGSNQRRWNTILQDIYPLSALLKDNNIENEEDGSISIDLNKDEEVFNIHLYKGSLLKDDVDKFIIKAIIDGRVYETELNIK